MIQNPSLSSLSLANLTLGRTPQTVLIEAAAAAGFGKVGMLLMTATAQPLQYEVLGQPQVIREIKAALSATGVRVFDVEAFVISPQTQLERFKPALELAAEFGASHISAIGTEFAPQATFLSPEQRVELFARLCDMAAQFGLTVGVEFMLYRDIRTWQEALALIEAAGRSNAGLILDLLHFHRAGANAADLAQIPPQRLAYAQLCDAAPQTLAVADLPGEARTARLHLGEGAIALDAILAQLPAELPLVIETPVTAEAALTSHARARLAAQRSQAYFAARAVRAP